MPSLSCSFTHAVLQLHCLHPFTLHPSTPPHLHPSTRCADMYILPCNAFAASAVVNSAFCVAHAWGLLGGRLHEEEGLSSHAYFYMMSLLVLLTTVGSFSLLLPTASQFHALRTEQQQDKDVAGAANATAAQRACWARTSSAAPACRARAVAQTGRSAGGHPLSPLTIRI